MKLLSIRPILYTHNVKESIDFYVANLGFTCNIFDVDTQWAAVSRDLIQIMISKPNDHTPFLKPVFSGSLYINIDCDIEPLWEDLKNKATVCYQLQTFDYGMKEFAIYDNNGYVIQFGEEFR